MWEERARREEKRIREDEERRKREHVNKLHIMEEKRMREEEDKKRKKIGHVEDDSLRQVFNEKKKNI